VLQFRTPGCSDVLPSWKDAEIHEEQAMSCRRAEAGFDIISSLVVLAALKYRNYALSRRSPH
jgi:hypothetical protein